MELRKGERIFLKPKNAGTGYSGEVISSEMNGLLIELDTFTSNIKEGDSFILIIERPDYYNEFKTSVVSINDRKIRLRWHWTERREFFRIDDIIALSARKVSPSEKKPSIIMTGDLIEVREFIEPDPSINPAIWRMLNEINNKLNILLKYMEKEKEISLPRVRYQKVNISAGGIRFLNDEPVSKGDIMELSMQLNTCPPLNIITYGEVVRVTERDGKYEVALSFKDTEDEIREAILRYTLQRQREIMKKEK
ncbi:MAG: PilZ domain-containing protein [Thermodesulfovibrionales bacterium]|nr:PilZ domain-containing protein [Thermodesulfovibrionales bacterium]